MQSLPLKGKTIIFGEVCQIHLRRFWRLYLAIGVILAVFQQFFTFGYNNSPSIPMKFFVVVKGAEVHRGDVMVFHWKGDRQNPQGALFVKYVKGVPGDVVTVKGAAFFVNGQPVGIAKQRDHFGELLVPNQPKRLGPDEYYGYGTHPKSMDSRYAKVGYIHRCVILGRAIPIF
jgi:conjugal transfer pilin signal peptidase TrbI